MKLSDLNSCYYSQAIHNVIDIIHPLTGLTLYSKETFAQVQARHPDAELTTLDDASTRQEREFLTDPAPITEEQYWYWLEVLPPINWHRTGDGEVFQVSEITCGRVTQTCAKIGDGNGGTRYFGWQDIAHTPHLDLIAKARGQRAA